MPRRSKSVRGLGDRPNEEQAFAFGPRAQRCHVGGRLRRHCGVAGLQRQRYLPCSTTACCRLPSRADVWTDGGWHNGECAPPRMPTIGRRYRVPAWHDREIRRSGCDDCHRAQRHIAQRNRAGLGRGLRQRACPRKILRPPADWVRPRPLYVRRDGEPRRREDEHGRRRGLRFAPCDSDCWDYQRVRSKLARGSGCDGAA
jgi:hypothetical protein